MLDKLVKRSSVIPITIMNYDYDRSALLWLVRYAHEFIEIVINQLTIFFIHLAQTHYRTRSTCMSSKNKKMVLESIDIEHYAW